MNTKPISITIGAAYAITALIVSGCDATNAAQSATKPTSTNASLLADELKGQWEMHNLFETGSGDGGTKIKICDRDCSSADAKKVSEQHFQVEIGIRDGKLVGCQVSDEKGPTDSVTCSMVDDSLQVELGRTANKVLYELRKTSDGNFSGETFMKSTAFPGGKMKIGKVSLKRATKS